MQKNLPLQDNTREDKRGSSQGTIREREHTGRAREVSIPASKASQLLHKYGTMRADYTESLLFNYKCHPHEGEGSPKDEKY